MIDGQAVVDVLATAGLDFYSGVPCSYLTPVMNAVLNAPRAHHVPATSEGEAVAIAAGGWLAGRGAIAMAQNSGLGNMVNPLTSLNAPFGIPLLLLVTWRGQPDGAPDEPQHALMGRITHDLLGVMDIPHWTAEGDLPQFAAQVAEAARVMEQTQKPGALVLRKGLVDGPKTVPPITPIAARAPLPSITNPARSPELARAEVLETVLAAVPDSAALIATTGKTGRELFTLADRPQHLYLVGSMGGAAGVGLGVALNVRTPVVVLDGDGALLMKMGSLATVAAHQPDNLVHVLLDNGVHDSTGGQPTVSPNVAWAQVAVAAGYRQVFEATSRDEVSAAVATALQGPGPTFVHVRIRPGSMDNLGRPTVTPYEVARRFRDFLAPHRVAAQMEDTA